MIGTHYQSLQTNLQRSIAPWKSKLVIGDAYTDGALFDSVSFRGVQVSSDDRMYPESLRGYAPTLYGMASSNAVVRVLQGGNVIYETNVAPGPFEINDLYPTGYGEDLEVEVTESNGRQHVTRVPYTAPVNALRPGSTRYSLTLGQYRDVWERRAAPLFEGTLSHGFTNVFTIYAGVQASTGYTAGLIGVALNTGFGDWASTSPVPSAASPVNRVAAHTV